MDDFKLWCDLITDAERVDFLRSGRAWKTGIIAEAVADDVADAFEFRMRAQQEDSADKSPCNCPAKDSCPEYDGAGGCVLCR